MGRYNFRKGDRLKVNSGSSVFNVGDIVTCETDVDTDSSSAGIDVTLSDGRFTPNWRVDRFNLEKGRPGRPKKVPPIELHLLVEDGCRNVIRLCDNYDKAVEESKGYSTKQTIYKLVKVADVDSVRQIKRIVGGRPKKKK